MACDHNGKPIGDQRGNTGNLRPWKPGQSGNPAGRPKGRGLTDRLRKLLEEDNGRVADELILAAKQAALKGDFRFWKEIIDRMDGPIRQQIEQRIERIVVEWDEPEESRVSDD